MPLLFYFQISLDISGDLWFMYYYISKNIKSIVNIYIQYYHPI